MVYRRTEVSHKLSRTPCRVLRHQNLLQKQSSRTCQTVDGQSISSGLHQQNGGTHSKTLAKLAIDLWNWCLDHKIHMSAEHLPGVLNLRADKESRVVTEPQRLEVEPSIFQNPGPVTSFCELETRSLGNRLCFSTFCPCRALFTAGNCAERRPFSFSSSCMASTALVPSSSTLSSGQASVISSRPRAFNRRQSCTPFDQPSIGCMGTISQHY